MRRKPNNNELLDSILVGHNEDDNKEKIYVNTITINDILIKLILLLLILSALFTFVFYMYLTINEHRDFMNKTTETLYAFSPDSRVLNWVLKPQSSPDNIIPSLISQITATIHCTPPRASPSVSPVIRNVVNSLLQGYNCPFKDMQEIPTECYANAYFQDPTTNDINPCFDSSEIEAFCLVAILMGLDNGIIDLDRDPEELYASRFDQTIRFVQPNPRPSGNEYNSLCPLRSIEDLTDGKIYLSKGPPYSIDIDYLTQYGHEAIPGILSSSSIPLLGTTVSSAAMHMSTVPFVQEMAGVQFYVSDNEIIEVEFYVNIGNIVYRPDLFYDTNDAWSLSFRSIPTAYTIYPVCRAYEAPVGNEKLQCKIATQFHAEYSFSQENNLDLTDPNVYNEYIIPKTSEQSSGKIPFSDYVWRKNSLTDNGYYNRFSSTRRIKTIFQTRGTGDNYLVECHPLLVWDIPDLTVPTPPSIQDQDFFTCTSHAGVLTSYPAGIIDRSLNDNKTCVAYVDNLSLCKENKMFPGVEHCARKINNAGLFSIHTDTIVNLIVTDNPRAINVQFKESSNYNTINDTYFKHMGVLQTWCNINPLTNFTTPGWSNNTYSQNTSCCTKQTSYLFGGTSFEQPETSNLCNLGSSSPTPSLTRTPTRSPTRTITPTRTSTPVIGALCVYDCSGIQYENCIVGINPDSCPSILGCSFLDSNSANCSTFTPTPIPSGASQSVTPSITATPTLVSSGYLCQYICSDSSVFTQCLIGASSCPVIPDCTILSSTPVSMCVTPTPVSTITSTPNPVSVQCEYQCHDTSTFIQCIPNSNTCPMTSGICTLVSTTIIPSCPSISSTPSPTSTSSATSSLSQTPSRSRSSSSTTTPSITSTPTINSGQFCTYSCDPPNDPTINVCIKGSIECPILYECDIVNSASQDNCPDNVSGIICEYFCYNTNIVPQCYTGQYTCNQFFGDNCYLIGSILVSTCA